MNFRKVGSGILVGIYVTAVVTAPLTFYSYSTSYKKATLFEVPLVTDRELDVNNSISNNIDSDSVPVGLPTPIAKIEDKVIAVLTNFQVTWYNNDYLTGITATGTKATAGRTVSVDPKLIKLGTWIEITMPSGEVLKRKAEDTGGAVHGRILDVFSTCSRRELLRRGRTLNVTVKILRGN